MNNLQIIEKELERLHSLVLEGKEVEWATKRITVLHQIIITPNIAYIASKEE
jgi:hypothetical protein